MHGQQYGKVLIVDDDAEFGIVAKNLVEVEGFSAHLVSTAREALEVSGSQPFDVVLLDLMLGETSGLDLLRTIRLRHPLLPVILVTAHGSIETAAEALQAEAFDYLGKPFRSAELVGSLQRALEWRAGQHLPRNEPGGSVPVVTSIVGRSPAMIAVYRVIARVAATDSTVLISGESGTGKELVARALHDNSPRARRPFVPVNCGAFTETLLESELFGHVRGAFTGALNNHRGIFETASGGTIFLDEISETSLAFQVKLLRVLQEHEVRPVGASDSRRTDVRIVAATNRRVEDLLASDDFRRDLLYRLGVINIDLPPLRERREDIPLLIEHFLARVSSQLGKRVVAPRETIAWLSSLEWAGNVRELENAVERAVTLNLGGRLQPDDFTRFTPTPLVRSGGVTPSLREVGADLISSGQGNSLVCEMPCTLEEVERQHILAMLRYTRGNRLRAAELLGIGRYSLYRKAERLGIDLEAVATQMKHSA
ncbi:MAG: sigma-54 dependent transcriptional regulator [Acidobacteriota bacterium]